MYHSEQLAPAPKEGKLVNQAIGPFRIFDDLGSPDEFIRGDNYLALSKKLQDVVYVKRDFLLKSGLWRGDPQPSLISRFNEVRGKVVILGHSDTKTPKQLSSFLCEVLGLEAVFGANTEPNRGCVQSIPLGITNRTQETPLHPVLGNENHFFLADSEYEFPSEFHPRLYANFTAGNNKSSRKRLTDALRDLPPHVEVTYEQPEFTEEGLSLIHI